MSSEKEKALDKIKKLLRMKRGGTPDEVATALDALTSARIYWECKYAGLVCQEFFNVSLILRQRREFRFPRIARNYQLLFIGTERDIQIALYIYHYLVRHFRHCWNTGRGRCRNRQAFFYGMYIGLCSKLNVQRVAQVNEAGLILLDRQLALRKDYERATFGKLGTHDTTPDCDASAAKRAGFMAGRATEIRSGIGSSGQAALLLS